MGTVGLARRVTDPAQIFGATGVYGLALNACWANGAGLEWVDGVDPLISSPISQSSWTGQASRPSHRPRPLPSPPRTYLAALPCSPSRPSPCTSSSASPYRSSISSPYRSSSSSRSSSSPSRSPSSSSSNKFLPFPRYVLVVFTTRIEEEEPSSSLDMIQTHKLRSYIGYSDYTPATTNWSLKFSWPYKLGEKCSRIHSSPGFCQFSTASGLSHCRYGTRKLWMGTLKDLRMKISSLTYLKLLEQMCNQPTLLAQLTLLPPLELSFHFLPLL